MRIIMFNFQSTKYLRKEKIYKVKSPMCYIAAQVVIRFVKSNQHSFLWYNTIT